MSPPGDLNASTCPHCGKPIVTQVYETVDGNLVSGRLNTSTVHVTVHRLNGSRECSDRAEVQS